MSLQKKLQILDNKIQLNSILYCEKLLTYLSYTTHLSKKKSGSLTCWKMKSNYLAQIVPDLKI